MQSYPEKNSFDSFFFLCDLDGHIEEPRVQKSLEDLGLHCQDFHVLGVFEASKTPRTWKSWQCNPKSSSDFCTLGSSIWPSKSHKKKKESKEFFSG